MLTIVLLARDGEVFLTLHIRNCEEGSYEQLVNVFSDCLFVNYRLRGYNDCSLGTKGGSHQNN